MRDTIFDILQEVYDPHNTTGENTFAYAVNGFLADNIVQLLTNGTSYIDGPDYIYREILTNVWFSWPGGSVAEIATEKICQALDIPLSVG